MSKKAEPTYQEAIAEVEKIVAQLESNELDVDTLAQAVKRATELLEMCKQKLYAVEAEVNKTLTE